MERYLPNTCGICFNRLTVGLTYRMEMQLRGIHVGPPVEIRAVIGCHWCLMTDLDESAREHWRRNRRDRKPWPNPLPAWKDPRSSVWKERNAEVMHVAPV